MPNKKKPEITNKPTWETKKAEELKAMKKAAEKMGSPALRQQAEAELKKREKQWNAPKNLRPNPYRDMPDPKPRPKNK